MNYCISDIYGYYDRERTEFCSARASERKRTAETLPVIAMYIDTGVLSGGVSVEKIVLMS